MTSFKKSSFVSVTCFRGAMEGREEDGGRSEGATLLLEHSKVLQSKMLCMPKHHTLGYCFLGFSNLKPNGCSFVLLKL